MKGHMLDKDFIETNGFTHPILVKDSAGLDLKVPDSSFTVNDVEFAVGMFGIALSCERRL